MASLVDKLISFVNQMKGFDKGIILAEFDKTTNTFVYQQRSKSTFSTSIRELYFPVKRRVHLLIEGDYLTMIEQLSTVIERLTLGSTIQITPRFEEGGISFWEEGAVQDGLYFGPRMIARIKLKSISNPFLVWFILRFYDKDSRNLLKFLKYKKRQLATPSNGL